MITVSGEYKPGRVRFTITDFTIPMVGMPITIGRTYDSLEHNEIGDFGYGWSLAIGNPKLEADLAHNVTLTMPDGRRSTFYFTPQPYPQEFGIFKYPHYTPEAGVYGKLEAPDCLVVNSNGKYFCFLEGEYSPTEYTYTDPYGRKFLMDADGTLRSITDLNNNVLTFSPTGITSSAGNISVPFARDAQGRITKITYPAGKDYIYEYTDNSNTDTGELRTVTFPSVTSNGNQQAIVLKYDYFSDHNFKLAIDPRNNQPVITTYDSAGRMASVTDAANNLTTYSYDLTLHQTTIHYLGNPSDPNNQPLGDAVLVYYDNGDLKSYMDPLGHTTNYEYAPNTHNLSKVTDPLQHAIQYVYNTDGHPTSIIDPFGKTLGTVDYNQYGGPKSLTTIQGGSATVQYNQTTFMPESASDNIGSLGGYTWTPQGNPDTYTDQYGNATHYTYTAQGYVETKTSAYNTAIASTTHYAYDDFGRVTDVITAFTPPNNVPALPESSTTHYKYDELGRMVESTIAFGTSRAATTKYEYDQNGNRTAVVEPPTSDNPLGVRIEYQYDNANRLILVTYAAQASPSVQSKTQYVYDVYGRLTDEVIALGTADESTTHYAYDAAGRKTDVTIAYGKTYASTTHYDYYDDGRVKDVTIAANSTADAAKTHYDYDAAGRTTDVTIAYGTTDASKTHSTYYDSGLLKTTTTAYGTNFAATTTYFYDTRGRSTITQYADGTTTSQQYDITPSSPGWTNTTTDQAGVTTKSVYDEAGRLDQLITAAFDPAANQTIQHITNYDYNAADQLTDTFDPLNHHTSYTYYPTGQMATSTAWKDVNTPYTTTYDYNVAGAQISVTDANQHTTQYQYNERGLLKKTIYPLGTGETGEIATSQTYDFAGRLLTSTDENSIVTRNAYNAAGQLISVTMADGTADATLIQYGYNFAGQLSSITDAKSHVTSFLYDKAGRQIKKTLPDTTTYEQYGYNAAGNMISHRLGDGHTDTFKYDKLNRLTDIFYYDGRGINFGYTNDGQRKTASLYAAPLSAPQVYTYAYDPFERLQSVTYPDGKSVSYNYFDNDLRQRMVTPAATIMYGYDGLNRLTSVTAGSAITTFQYDPVGFLKEKDLPNGTNGNVVKTFYTPNVRNQLTNVTSKLGNTVLQSFDYQLDKAGTRKQVTEAGGGTIIWGYDNLYRLTSETRGSTTTQFHYDLSGNRDWVKVNGVTTTTYNYNALDQLTSAGSVTYQYDGRGNLNKAINGTQTTTYNYNSADQLGSVTLPNNTTYTYAYDADGRRVKQTVGSTVTNYLWDEASMYGDVVYEYNGSGAMLASYVMGGTQLISQTRSGTTSYYLQDGQGSTRALTNSAGTVTDSYSYNAFGDLNTSSGSTVNPYRYTGQQFDTATGLYDLRARYYSPLLGRFMSQDTNGVNFRNPIELNRYVYAANRPINLTDPTGKAAMVEYALVLGVGAATGIALTHFCGGDVAINGIFGALGAALFWAVVPPPLAVLIGLYGALSAIQEIEVKGPNACSGFKAAASLLMVAFSANGLTTREGYSQVTRLDYGPKGSFFENAKTGDYPTDNLVVGQRHITSCVAACARMLMGDPLILEDAILWDALGIDPYIGTNIKVLPDYLASKGFPGYRYVEYPNMLDVIRSVQSKGPAVVSVGAEYDPTLNADIGHAIIVDEIVIDNSMDGGGYVAIRDPLPIEKGSSYYLSWLDFVAEYIKGGSRVVYKP